MTSKRLGVDILTGEEAVERFDADRQASDAAQTAAAVARLNEPSTWLKLT